MEIREICKEIGISAKEFYENMHTIQQKLSYFKKTNKERYNDMVTAGIVNHFKIDHEELIAMIKLYKMQQTK